jgi:TRIAD3 protein (E3 ubiquitin-protein ligase RNF216)
MAQCDEAHLFCATCVKSYAEAQLGSQTVEIVCMDTSGCKAVFSEAELRRILDEKLMTLHDRLSAQANLDKAGIEGLEECPFCEYRCVIDNEHEKLFRCRRMECLKISCRACKKLDHLPKTCQGMFYSSRISRWWLTSVTEVTEDGALDAQHEIEEAMSM